MKVSDYCPYGVGGGTEYVFMAPSVYDERSYYISIFAKSWEEAHARLAKDDFDRSQTVNRKHTSFKFHWTV